MKTINLAAAFAAWIAVSLSAQAQPITVTNTSSGGSGFFSGGTAGTYQSNESANHTVSGAAYAFNIRNDVAAQFTGTATTFGYQSATRFTLQTGAAPVLLTAIALNYNGKEVVSGGSSASFIAAMFYRAQLYVEGFGSDVGYATYLPDRTTQGIFVTDESHELPSTLLAANQQYTLYMDIYPIVQLSSYSTSGSMLGYTVEAGGTVAPQFDGLTLQFNAVAVPEPSSTLMLGAGIVALLALRRQGRRPAGT